MSDYDDLTIHDVMSAAELAEDERDAELRLDAADEERALQADAEDDSADLDCDEEPCGEGMCNCHCGEGHVCGCDCWRCDDCTQTREYCMCDEDGEW